MNATIQTIFLGFSESTLHTGQPDYRFADEVERDYPNCVVTKLKGKVVTIFFRVTNELDPFYPTVGEVVAAIHAGNIMRGDLPAPEKEGFRFFIATQTLTTRVVDVPIRSLPGGFDWKTVNGCIGRIDGSPFELEPFDMGELDPAPIASFLFKEDKDAIFFKLKWT